jgi:hypothetical protein
VRAEVGRASGDKQARAQVAAMVTGMLDALATRRRSAWEDVPAFTPRSMACPVTVVTPFPKAEIAP